MVYFDYSPKALILEYATWYKLKNLMDVLKISKKLNFHNLSEFQRERILNLYVEAEEVRAPYSSSKRFPEDEYYICDMVGTWSISLHKILSILRTDVITNSEIREFFNAVADIFLHFSNRNFVFSRREFEESYELTWVDC